MNRSNVIVLLCVAVCCCVLLCALCAAGVNAPHAAATFGFQASANKTPPSTTMAANDPALGGEPQPLPPPPPPLQLAIAAHPPLPKAWPPNMATGFGWEPVPSAPRLASPPARPPLPYLPQDVQAIILAFASMPPARLPKLARPPPPFRCIDERQIYWMESYWTAIASRCPPELSWLDQLD